MTTFRNATHPTMDVNRVDMLVKKFGTIHKRVNEVSERGLTIHWKTDKRLINMGTCYYRPDVDTYYVKSSCNMKHCRSNGAIQYDDGGMIYLEIERSRIDRRYSKIKFSVRSPQDDINKIKIVPCESHAQQTGAITFFSIKAAENDMTCIITQNECEDSHSFDISKNYNQFMAFKLRFWCWNVCKKFQFSNRKASMRFIAILCGENVEDIVAYSNLNVQQNPGRGAQVIKKILDTNPNKNDINGNTSWQSTGPVISTSQLGQSLLQPPNRVNFFDSGQTMKINVEVPRSFFEALGIEQARIELESIKREICSIANSRINDAIKRKIAANTEILNENGQLKVMIQNLQSTI